MTAQAKLDQIDKALDVVQRAVVRRAGHFNAMSCAGWQKAWDRNPGMRRLEKRLLSERYDAQSEVYAIAAKEARRAELAEQRAYRKAAQAKRAVCPTCGQVSFMAA